MNSIAEHEEPIRKPRIGFVAIVAALLICRVQTPLLAPRRFASPRLSARL
jgi:hypothetical protein